jgi:hypothetical protein
MSGSATVRRVLPNPSRAQAARWPWPAPVRLLVGAAAGWVVAEGLLRSPGPEWLVWVATGALALAALAAPGADAWAGRGVTSGIALVTVVGIYLGPPETGQVAGLALVLAVLWLAELTGRAYVDGLVVLLLDVVLVWAVLWGAAGRPGAIIGGAAMLGLLLVAPVAKALPGPAAGLPREWQGLALVLLQLMFVGGVARTAALWESAVDAALVTAGALVLLTVLARLIVGGRGS